MEIYQLMLQSPTPCKKRGQTQREQGASSHEGIILAMPMIQNPETVLKNVFGYDEFRPLQAEIIENILNRNDSLVIMPTGGGKSICYQIPSLIFEGLTIVISPLISLMKDQVEQLIELGVGAVLLNSTLSPAQYRHNVIQIKERRAKLLYIAPESLLKQGVLEMLSSVQVDCMAIDEAHCISEWGHDFRPEYRQLSAVRERFSNVVCVALTATATQRVRDDIKKRGVGWVAIYTLLSSPISFSHEPLYFNF